jgi:hypothetical protein
MRKLCGLLPLMGLFFGFSATTQAAEVTRVASSFDGDNKFDLHFGVGYDFNFKKAALLREWSDANNPSSTVVRDLLYQQFRHVVTPTLEIGLYKDLAVYVHIPIVVADSRTYSFDQEADPCVYGDGATIQNPATCVNHDNSTRSATASSRGWLRRHQPEQPVQPVRRRGQPDDLQGRDSSRPRPAHVGLKYAILNQDRLSHMPKWVIGLEGRFAVGKPMTFSRDTRPPTRRATTRSDAACTSSASGPRSRAATASSTRSSRRGGTRRSAPATREFKDFGGAQDRVNPQSQLGVTFGTEIVPFERKAKGQKVSVVIRGLAMLKYNGRGYSEGWELFSDSPALIGSNNPANATCTNQDARGAVAYANDPNSPTNVADPDYIANSGASSGCVKSNGITNIQDFATFGINFGLNFQLNKYAVLMLGMNSSTDTRHFISNASRGKAALGGDPNLVEPGSAEVNPVRRDVIDNVGRRYAVGDVLNVMGYFRFLLTF